MQQTLNIQPADPTGQHSHTFTLELLSATSKLKNKQKTCTINGVTPIVQPSTFCSISHLIAVAPPPSPIKKTVRKCVLIVALQQVTCGTKVVL